MKYLTIDEVYAIHLKMIEIGGGNSDVHDFTLLHSAIERPKATFGGNDLYPDIWQKGAALIHSLIHNHPFTDGNKRTAYYSLKRFLYVNGYNLFAEKNEVITFTKSIDVINLPLKKIVTWIKHNSKKNRY